MKLFTSRQMQKVRPEKTALSQVGIFMGGMFVGGLAGAGAMLLFAPRSGRRTRAKMRHQYDELRDQLGEVLEDAEDDLLAQAHHVADNVRKTAKELDHQRKSALAGK